MGMKYQLITANDAASFTELVQQALDEGYELHGQHRMVMVEIAATGKWPAETLHTFSQALIKREAPTVQHEPYEFKA